MQVTSISPPHISGNLKNHELIVINTNSEDGSYIDKIRFSTGLINDKNAINSGDRIYACPENEISYRALYNHKKLGKMINIIIKNSGTDKNGEIEIKLYHPLTVNDDNVDADSFLVDTNIIPGMKFKILDDFQLILTSPFGEIKC